jgi:hypothetical protein
MGLFSKSKNNEAWLAMVMQRDGIAAASVRRAGGGQAGGDGGRVLSRRARRRCAGKGRQGTAQRAYRCTTVLGGGEYQFMSVEAPNVPREELKTAMRWRLKDMLDFPVDDATIDVLDMPADPNAGRARPAERVRGGRAQQRHRGAPEAVRRGQGQAARHRHSRNGPAEYLGPARAGRARHRHAVVRRGRRPADRVLERRAVPVAPHRRHAGPTARTRPRAPHAASTRSRWSCSARSTTSSASSPSSAWPSWCWRRPAPRASRNTCRATCTPASRPSTWPACSTSSACPTWPTRRASSASSCHRRRPARRGDGRMSQQINLFNPAFLQQKKLLRRAGMAAARRAVRGLAVPGVYARKCARWRACSARPTSRRRPARGDPEAPGQRRRRIRAARQRPGPGRTERCRSASCGACAAWPA